MALCNVTGTVYLPNGDVASRREVVFYKLPDNVTADYLGAVAPEPIIVRTDSAGELDVNLITGNYYGHVQSRNGKEKYPFRAIVPEAATADFADLITAVDPVEPLPAWLQQALQARDDAVQARDDAEAIVGGLGSLTQAVADAEAAADASAQSAVDASAAADGAAQAATDAVQAAADAQSAADVSYGYASDAEQSASDIADVKLVMRGGMGGVNNRFFQNNSATPYGIKIIPKPDSVWEAGIFQGFTYVPLVDEFFTSWDNSGQRVIMRHSTSGGFINASSNLDSIMGHGQDLNHFFDGNALTLVVENFARNGIIMATPQAADGGDLGNVREYKLLPDGWSVCWPNVSQDKNFIVAGMIEPSTSVRVRVFDIKELVSGGAGDYSDRFLFDLTLSPFGDYWGGDPNYNIVQGVAMDSNGIYVVTGDSGYARPKYISRFNILNKQREYRLLLETGKEFANSRGGVTYELEGIEWVQNASGEFSPWVGVVARQADGVGYDMYAMPIDPRGFGGAGVARVPNGVGFVAGYLNDTIIPEGQTHQIKRYTGPDSSDYINESTIAPDGTQYFRGRIRIGNGANLDPATSLGTGVNVKGDLGRIVACAPAVAMQLQSSSNSQIGQFFRGNTVVGTISVTETATSYNTTSDSTLKTDGKPLSFERACEIVSLITIYDYQWISNGERDIGAFAQELHKVYPQAVSVGGWFDESGNEVSSDISGARYVPWAVDHSKLVPVMMVALQGVLSRVNK